ncbi:LPXTG cell wall anchor domain-containing protein, partial [Staphylococcus ureilyticus]
DADADSDADSDEGVDSGVDTENDKNSTSTSTRNQSENDTKTQSEKTLPETGDDEKSNLSLAGGLFALAGSILLFRRRKNQSENQ